MIRILTLLLFSIVLYIVKIKVHYLVVIALVRTISVSVDYFTLFANCYSNCWLEKFSWGLWNETVKHLKIINFSSLLQKPQFCWNLKIITCMDIICLYF